MHYSETCIKRPRLGRKKKWSLNRGGLLIEVKMHCKATIGTLSSGPRIEVVSEYRWSQEQVSLYKD